VCTCVYKHTPTHHPNTCKIKEIYKTNPLSLPVPKHSPPHQQQAPTMDKLKKTLLSTPSYTRMQAFKNTCDTHACSIEIEQYKSTKCAYTSAHVHPWLVWSQVYIYCSVNNACPRVYPCLHRHIKHLSGAVFNPPHNMHICTHASTPGTTAWQRLCEKLMQMQEALDVSSVQRKKSHLAPPMRGLHCTQFLRPQYPSTPPPWEPPLPSSQQTPEQFADPWASAVVLSQH